MLPLQDNVPTKSTPVVTIGLIVANFLVWFWELGGHGVDYHVLKDGYYPCTVEGPCHVPVSIVIHPLPWYEGAFTAMFMHASWEHILGNMLFLWIFGNNIEDALGKVRFLGWYLTAGLFATATQTVVTLAAGSVTDASIPNIGACGAIAGVLGAYFVLLPRARVLTLIFYLHPRDPRALVSPHLDRSAGLVGRARAPLAAGRRRHRVLRAHRRVRLRRDDDPLLASTAPEAPTSRYPVY